MNRTGLVAVSASQGDAAIYLWEPLSLTVLATFADNVAASGQSLARYGAGLVAIQDKKTLLHYYKYGTATGLPHIKSTTVDRLRCIASWRHLVAGGLSSGSLRLWDSHSGELLASECAHSSAVISVAISESVVLTGGEDGLVREFRLADLYSGSAAPHFTYSHHSMTVTHVAIRGSRRFSASLDHSIGVLRDGTLIQKHECGSAMNCVEVDDQRIFAGGSDGSVYRFGASPAVWKWQSSSVTACALLTDCVHLLVAADCVYLLEAETGTRLKAFRMHKGAVTSLLVMERPEALTTVTTGQESLSPLAKTPSRSLRHPVVLRPKPPPEPVEASVTQESAQRASEREAGEKLRRLNQWIYGEWVKGWL